MATVTTALSPREAIIRLNGVLRELYGSVNAHGAASPGSRINWDRELVSDTTTFEIFEKKFNDALMQQLLADAKALYGKARQDPKLAPSVEQALQVVEDLLRGIKRHQWMSMKQAMYLRRLAKHLGGEIRGLERSLIQTEQEYHRAIHRQLKAEAQKKRNVRILEMARKRKINIPSDKLKRRVA